MAVGWRSKLQNISKWPDIPNIHKPIRLRDLCSGINKSPTKRIRSRWSDMTAQRLTLKSRKATLRRTSCQSGRSSLRIGRRRTASWMIGRGQNEPRNDFSPQGRSESTHRKLITAFWEAYHTACDQFQHFGKLITQPVTKQDGVVKSLQKLATIQTPCPMSGLCVRPSQPTPQYLTRVARKKFGSSLPRHAFTRKSSRDSHDRPRNKFMVVI